jgi:hypothetical protein
MTLRRRPSPSETISFRRDQLVVWNCAVSSATTYSTDTRPQLQHGVSVFQRRPSREIHWRYKMAVSKCAKCDGTQFEAVKAEPATVLRRSC